MVVSAIKEDPAYPGDGQFPLSPLPGVYSSYLFLQGNILDVDVLLGHTLHSTAEQFQL
jgi:hypothetical protein